MHPRLIKRFAGLLAILAIGTFTSIAAPTQRVKAEPIGILRLTAQNFHIYTSGNLRFVFSVDNPALLENLLSNQNALFRISLGSKVLGGAQEVRDIIAIPTRFVAIDTVELNVKDVRRRADGQFEVIALSTDVDTGTKRLEFQGAGIYPVRIETFINNLAQAGVTTFVNRFSATTRLDPMPINFVVSLDAPISLQPDGSHLIDDATRTKILRLVKLLELDAPLISMQIPGQIIDGLSKSKNPIDQALLVQFIAAVGTATLVDTTFVAFDSSDARRSKRDADFVALLAQGRTTWQLYAAKNPVASDTWIARTPLDQDGLDLLADSGFRSIVMLPDASQALGEFDNTARPYRLVSGKSTLSLHVADQSYVAQLSDPENNSFIGASALAAQLLAQRSKIESDGGTPSLRRIVLTSKDGSVINTELLHETLLILKRVPQQILIQTLKDLPEPRQDAFRPRLQPGKSTVIGERMKVLDALRVDLNKLKSSLNEDSGRWGIWNERMLVMSSDTLNESQRADFMVETRAELKALRTAITLQDGTTFTLGSRESQLRLDLQNSSAEDMTVQVRVASPKLRFIKSAAVIKVPANSSSELVVDVEALSNGLFPVEVRIFTADGLSQLGKKIEVSARVNALAGLGQVVSGVAFLLLATWWVAHLRRRFRKRISEHHPVLRSKL